jgi:hypothetical protein
MPTTAEAHQAALRDLLDHAAIREVLAHYCGATVATRPTSDEGGGQDFPNGQSPRPLRR